MIKRKVGVVINQGIGDCLLTIPLLSYLVTNKKNIDVFVIFEEGYNHVHLIEYWQISIKQFILPKNNLAKFKHCVKYANYFDEILLNHIAASKLWMIHSLFLSRTVTTNRSFGIINRFYKIKYKLPYKNIHEINQNLCLIDDKFCLNKECNYPLPKTSRVKDRQLDIKKPFILLQPLSANNQVDYKNWGIYNWAEFIALLLNYLPTHQIVLIGDDNEINASKHLADQVNSPRLFSMVGQTALTDVLNMIASCDGYIGLDSGWRHACVAYKKTTFCIWGATSPIQYGYEYLYPEKHRDISSRIQCHPCYAWPTRNQSRVKNAKKCPDFRCIRAVTPLKAFDEFTKFWNQL